MTLRALLRRREASLRKGRTVNILCTKAMKDSGPLLCLRSLCPDCRLQHKCCSAGFPLLSTMDLPRAQEVHHLLPGELEPL